MATNVSNSERGRATAGISVSVERPRNTEGRLHVSCAVNNGAGTVVNRDQPDGGRKLRLDVREKFPYRVRHFDGIGTRAPKYSNHHRGRRGRIPSHPETHINALVLNAVFRSGNVLKIDWRAIALSDDELLVLVGRAELPLRL